MNSLSVQFFNSAIPNVDKKEQSLISADSNSNPFNKSLVLFCFVLGFFNNKNAALKKNKTKKKHNGSGHEQNCKAIIVV